MSILNKIANIISEHFLEFKTNNEKEEWEADKLNKKLFKIVILIAFLSYVLYDKIIVITEVYRSQEENDTIYGWEKGCGKRRNYSVHSYWRGIDLRTSIYTQEQASTIAKVINILFPYDKNRPNKKTAVYGSGRHLDHIHLQVANQS